MWHRALLSTAARRRVLPAGPSFGEFVRGGPAVVKEEETARRKWNSEEEDLEDATPFLSDRFGRFHNYLRISLTERCNLRCTYCMPAEGVPLSPQSALLGTSEVVRLASVFARMGTTKIKLTGGEPTLRGDLVAICEAISRTPGISSVGMTTNGVTLIKSIRALREVGLKSVNVSLDSIVPETFATLTRRPPATLSRVLEAIDVASQLMDVKVNCVVMRGKNDDQLGNLVRYFADRPVELRFIEWMPFNANDWDRRLLVPAAEIREKLADLVPLPPRDPNDTTRWYSVAGREKAVGVISSMTEHFCGGCNRVRITSDGALKTCLFGDDAVSLRDLMRSGEDDRAIARAVRSALGNKHFAHGGRADGATGLAKHAASNRPMILIGG
ncbi:hypothetical protein CTAYLR_006097 [Chrysophaeum taylorii]|uniref:GTP 3',8-cyclase n=1 Tax=Chrysophaeum taylorii TaxID=2483200 RepID=A0AAD7U9G9_9STRA|nr:hypothetical protein CTAYLR_006097 [Chrysophaeum taylorii]